ncbi:PAS domain-containing protein, partial [Salmonella enterica]|uniref:PAS domain-containing protein n=1 Tax=Salmonella enterica TaxID=28901 RepID=UPI0035236342
MVALFGLVALSGVGIVLLLARLQRSALANQAAKRRHDNIVSQVSEGIFLATSDDAIIETNEAAHSLLGYTDEALKQSGLREIFLDLPETTELLADQDKGKL